MAKLTREILEQSLAALTGQAGQVNAAAMFEAGKAVGRAEGQISLLTQLVAMAKADEAEAAAPDLKLSEPDPGQDQ